MNQVTAENGRKSIDNVKKKHYLVMSGSMFSSSRAIVLMRAGSTKCGEREQGSTVDRNTWLALPPGQEDFYCKYTLSTSKHPTHMLSSCKQQSEPTATESQCPLTTFSGWIWLCIRKTAPEAVQSPHRTWKKNETSGSIWLNVYLCLGPSLSLSVDVLIAGLSGVLSGG